MSKITATEKSFLRKTIPLAAFIGGLCCFTPLVFVLVGLSSVSFAASLSDTLYGQYRWLFRGAALLFLLGALAWYFYKKEDICTFDKLKRKKRKVINMVLLSLVLGVLAYVVWFYVIVEIIGVVMGIW